MRIFIVRKQFRPYPEAPTPELVNDILTKDAKNRFKRPQLLQHIISGGFKAMQGLTQYEIDSCTSPEKGSNQVLAWCQSVGYELDPSEISRAKNPNAAIAESIRGQLHRFKSPLIPAGSIAVVTVH